MENSSLPLSRSGRTPIEVATYAAQEAGEVLVAHFTSKKIIKHKSRGNLVTEVDTLSEKLIVNLLKDEYPDHRVLSEETNATTPVNGYTWIVDPLDGTNNYVFGIPNFCVTIALVHDDDILLGITFDPLKKELFHTGKGRGTYLNNSLVQVTQISLLKDALVGFDMGYNDEQGKKMLGIANKLWGQVHCIRMMGSSALGLAYVACGRMSLYFHCYIYPWDIASGLLLVREAGGKVIDWQGNQAGFHMKGIIASNELLWKQFLSFY